MRYDIFDEFLDKINAKEFSLQGKLKNSYERFFNLGEFAKHQLNEGRDFPTFSEDLHLKEGFTGFVQNFRFDKYSLSSLLHRSISKKNNFPIESHYGAGDYAYISNGGLKYLQKGKFKVDWDRGGFVNKFQQFINGNYSTIKEFRDWPESLKPKEELIKDEIKDEEIYHTKNLKEACEKMVEQFEFYKHFKNAKEPTIIEHKAKFGFWANDFLYISVNEINEIDEKNNSLNFEGIIKKQWLAPGEVKVEYTDNYEDDTYEKIEYIGPKYGAQEFSINQLYKKDSPKEYNLIKNNPEYLLDKNNLVEFLKSAKINWRFNDLEDILDTLKKH